MRAALTINIAITELQGTLALRAAASKPTAVESRDIATHPTYGAKILRNAGVTDVEWLQAVEQHHERADGRGYPTAIRGPTYLATVLRYVDDFFAQTSARVSRSAMPLQQVVRLLHADANHCPIVEAVVREFGLYPPGTYVRLANGDLGIVLRRGGHINTPLAIALANWEGERLSRRVYRDTNDTRYAVVMASNPGDGRRL